MLRSSIDKTKENSFELTKERSKRYPAKTITEADYADDIAILANTPNQAEALLHSLEQTTAGIGLHVNARKTEYMSFNQTGDISTLDGTSLKLVDKFTYQGSNVLSTENDIDTQLTKAWTAIDKLSIIWKSDLTDKMKRSFFQAAVVPILLYGCTTWTLIKRLEKMLDGITKTIQVRRTSHAGHGWRSRDTLIRDVPPHMGEQKQGDQLKHTYSSYVRIQDVALKTCQRRWMIRRSGKRGSGISVLVARYDDEWWWHLVYIYILIIIIHIYIHVKIDSSTNDFKFGI